MRKKIDEIAINYSKVYFSNTLWNNGETLEEWKDRDYRAREVGALLTPSWWAWASDATLKVGNVDISSQRYTVQVLRAGMSGSYGVFGYLFLPNYQTSSENNQIYFATLIYNGGAPNLIVRTI